MTSGGRNLLILGVASVVFALATTIVSVAIYHNSGDIYLDRSVPGFMPDEDEIEQEGEEEDYTFPDSGALDSVVLDEYLEKLKIEIDAVDIYDVPFGEEILSDERLGIQ